LITKSETAYRAKLTNWQNLLAALTASEKELGDLHNLLMLAVTEPMIQKSQAGSLPDDSKAKEASQDLQQLINRIKAITK
jgi:hypothetical protein